MDEEKTAKMDGRIVPFGAAFTFFNESGNNYQLTLHSPASFPKLTSVIVRASSVINLTLWTVCTALEVYLIPASFWVGVWSSIIYMATGFVGFSTSFQTTRFMLKMTLMLALLSMLTSIVATLMAGFTGNGRLNHIIHAKLLGTDEQLTRPIQFSLQCASLLAMLNNSILFSMIAHTLYCSPKQQLKCNADTIEFPANNRESRQFSQSIITSEDCLSQPRLYNQVSIDYLNSQGIKN